MAMASFEESSSNSSKALLSFEDKVQAGLSHKEQGNQRFTAGDLKGALQAYHMAVLYLSGLSQTSIAGLMSQNAGQDNGDVSPDGTGAQSVSSDQKQLSLVYSNMAACHIKLAKYDRAVQVAEKATKADPSNIKAKFRKGQALRLDGELFAAKQVLEQAIAQHPSDKASFAPELALCEKAIQAKETASRSKLKGFLGRNPGALAS